MRAAARCAIAVILKRVAATGWHCPVIGGSARLAPPGPRLLSQIEQRAGADPVRRVFRDVIPALAGLAADVLADFLDHSSKAAKPASDPLLAAQVASPIRLFHSSQSRSSFGIAASAEAMSKKLASGSLGLCVE